MSNNLNEQIEDLMVNNLKLIQNKTLYRFTTDAVLLADFTKIKPRDVLADFCAGSGVVPVLILGKTDRVSRAYAVEVQEELATLARRNAELNSLGDRLTVLNMSVQESVAALRGQKITVITANPPYMPKEAGLKCGDYGRAVARSEMLLSLRELVRSAAAVLGTGGRFNLVHTASRTAEIMYELGAASLTPKTLRFVKAKPASPCHLVLIEAVKGGGNDLKIMDTLIIADEGGRESEEIKRIYNRKSKEE